MPFVILPKNHHLIVSKDMTNILNHYESWQFSSINILDPLLDSSQPALSFNTFIGELVRGLDGKIDLGRHPWPFEAQKDCQLSLAVCNKRLTYSFTSYHNVLYLESEADSYFLYVCNTIRPTVPLVAFALLSCSSDQLVLSLPFINDKNWQSFDIVSRFSGSFPGEGLQSRLARHKAFKSINRAQALLLCTYKNNHLGHYILNDIGPSNDIFPYLRQSKGKLELARINPGFVTNEAETSFIAGKLSDETLVRHFPGVFSMNKYAKDNSLGLFFLHGANVENSLSLNVIEYIEEVSDSHDRLCVIKENLQKYSATIVVSIRTGNRAALNIEEVAEMCFLSLSKDLQRSSLFLIDGLASQVNEPRNNTTANLSMDEELKLAQSIVDKITLRGGAAISIVGMNLLEQLAWMQNVILVVGHISSASVKYLCLLGKPQLLHSSTGKSSTRLSINPWNEGVDIIFGKAYKESTHPVEIFTSKDCVAEVVPLDSPGSFSESKLASRSNYLLNSKMVASLFYAFFWGLHKVSKN
jgi:hypothetical protein